MGALTCEALESRLQRGFEDAEESIEVFDAGTSRLNVLSSASHGPRAPVIAAA